jgi:uncharacterized protein (TIGR02001 family)
MRNLRILTALGLVAAAGAANAGVTSTWTLTNDYDFRGNSQSAKDPAIQGSIDYAHESGWYIGAWASNIDFFEPDADPKYELDLYSGFTGTTESGLGWDAGLVYYTYPQETDFNYFEIYGSLSKDWFKGKIWYSNKFGGTAAEDLAKALAGTDKVSAWYVEGNATFPLPENFSVILHAGYSFGDYWDNAFGDKQLDYAAGVGYTAGNFTLALKYVDTSGDIKVRTDEFNNEGRVIFTVATTFPWKKE